MILPAALLSALLFSLPGHSLIAYAQSESGLTVTARLGFDGYCKENHWLPVHVNVENTGSDLNTTVQVSYKNGGGGNTVTSLDVLLPASSRKEFFLYIFPQGSIRSLRVNLVSERRVIKKIDLPMTCLSRDNMVFGVLADNPSTYDVLNEVKPLMGFVRVAQLTIEDLPANSQAWRSLDALIISNVDTGRLTPEQKQALKSWLAHSPSTQSSMPRGIERECPNPRMEQTPPERSNSGLVTDACVAALLRRAYYSAAKRGR